MFKIGKGVEEILLISFVGPDEPIGILTLQALVDKLFNNEQELLSNYTWYFIPAADPYGAKLNEGWFKDPYNIKSYILKRFNVKVIEWKLPSSCGDYTFSHPTLEALAVKKAIDMAKPDLIVPLHNNDFSGLYFFLSRNIPESVPIHGVDLKPLTSKYLRMSFTMNKPCVTNTITA